MQSSAHWFTSPLRYPGGKGMLANFAKLVITQNDLLDGHYVELYAGGAGIGWSLLFDEYVQYLHLNDISRPVYAFWKAALEHTDELCERIAAAKMTAEEWCHQKEIQGKPNRHSLLDLGFSTFYLNRTNRSGILTGGVIGGKNQKGKWKMDARFNKNDLIARIQRISRYRSRVNLYNTDAVQFIDKTLRSLPARSLVYLDPPYYMKGADLYENHYSDKDHLELSNKVTSRIKQAWIVSYDNVPQIRTLYKGYRSVTYSLNYSAQAKYAGSEIIFFCHSLKIPSVLDPTKGLLCEPLRKCSG